jgi:putative MATE family efflux protein
MRLMGAEPEVIPHGVDFLRAGSVSFPFVMILYALAGSFRGAGNTWLVMVILIIVNAINAAVTFLLISGVVAELEVLASGIGYACGGIGGGVLALILAFTPIGPMQIDLSVFGRLQRASFRRLLRIGVPVGLEETQFMLAFLVYTAIVATLGTEQLAAHALALRSLEVAILPAFALGTAATALVGQRLGASDPIGAEEVAKRVRFFALTALLAMAVVQFAFAPYIVRLFVDDPDVVDTGTNLLRVFAFALPAMGVHASISGALRGAGDVRFVLATFTISAWGVRVPLAALLVVGLGLTVPFAWLAAVTENWVRAVLVSWRFRAGRWKSMKV